MQALLEAGAKARSAGAQPFVLDQIKHRETRSNAKPMAGDLVGLAIGTRKLCGLIYVTRETVWYQDTAEVARRFSPRPSSCLLAEPRGAVTFT